MNIKEKFWIGTFIVLWVLVSTVSTFHSVEFFGLSNNIFFSWCIAIGFEIGAMASLGGLIISKGNKTIIWGMFFLLTAFQIHGNMYWAWIHSGDISGWVDLFGLVEEDPIFQKRIFAFISGGILPIVSLGFIKSLMDYLKPKDDTVNEEIEFDEAKSNNLIEKFDPTVNFIGGHANSETWGSTGTDLEYEKAKDSFGSTGNDFDPSSRGEEFEEITEKVHTKRNKKTSNLEDIIDSAESTVNTIGEK